MIVEHPLETMLAAVLYAARTCAWRRNPGSACRQRGSGSTVGAALTCGTDLKVYRRGYHAAMLKPPAVFGHEMAGVVAEVGDGVKKFKVGDRVAPMNSAPCDSCFYCRRGQQNLCEHLLSTTAPTPNTCASRAHCGEEYDAGSGHVAAATCRAD